MIFLASTSPRRQDLLRKAGLAYACIEPGPEPEGQGTPIELAEFRAGSKARGAQIDTLERSGLVLGSDTVVEAHGREWAKASDPEEARQMLRALAGQRHVVHTAHAGFALPFSGSEILLAIEVVSASVELAPWDDALYEPYLRSGAWRGKAGAYGLQDAEQGFAVLAEGDFDAVVGLSLSAVHRLAERCGVALERGAG